MKIIRLTNAHTEMVVYVMAESVQWVGTSAIAPHHTIIAFGSEENGLEVEESPEQVVELIHRC